MFFIDALLQPLFIACIILHAAFVCGRFITKKIDTTKEMSASVLGLSLLIGYGVFGYIVLILSFFPPIAYREMVAVLIVLIAGGYKYNRELYTYVFAAMRSLMYRSKIERLISLLVLCACIFYAISAFVPPYRVDALAYHIPEAVQIAEKGIFSLGGKGNFFGNLPILIETLYAPAHVLSGVSAMNLIHYSIFLSGCLFVYGYVRRRFSALHGLVAVLSLFSIYELLVNATSAYVDAATVAFEVAGILLFIDWMLERKKEVLIYSGVLCGLALSTKYLPLYSLVIIAGLFLYTHIQKREKLISFIKNGLYFSIPLIACAGFWYIKNIFITGNPLYPFIFSHDGLTQNDLDALSVAVKQFGDRDIVAFLLFPFKQFIHPLYLHVIGAFVLLPFAFFSKKETQWMRILSTITIVYFTVWFFFISHQKRFAMTAISLLLIIASILLSSVIEKYKVLLSSKKALYVYAVMLLVVIYGLYLFRNNYYIQAKTAEVRYVIGIDSTEFFYDKRGMGPAYRTSKYINTELKEEKVLNLWSDPDFFLEYGNTFVAPNEYIREGEVATSTLVDYLNHDSIKYILTVSEEAKQTRLNDEYFKTNAAEQDYYKHTLQYVLQIEDIVSKIADPIYQEYDRVLYKVR